MRLCSLLLLAALTVWIRPTSLDASSHCTADGLVCLEEVDSAQPLGTRVPVILVHGWSPETVPGPPHPQIWNEFIAYYGRSAELQQRTKLYLVAYTSNVAPLVLLGRGLRTLVSQMGARDPHGFGAKPLVLVGHSMGGLLARYFLTLETSRVLRVITLGTPHHGSPLANGPAMRERAGSWGSALTAFDRIFFANGPSWFDVNRSDLRWDNYDGLLDYDRHPEEHNPLLTNLNGSTAADAKLVAYGGAVAPAASCGRDQYCWGTTVLGGVFGLASDGVVPVSSALLYGSAGTSRVLARYFPGYNHAQLATGAGGAELFDRLAADLVAVLGSPPGRPTLSAAAREHFVTISWTAGPGGVPDSYFLEVGRGRGASDVFASSVGLATSVSGTIPGGTYYIRVTARNATGSSTSAEVELRVGATVVPPGRPILTVSVTGNVLDVNWAAGPGGPPTSYFLAVGTSPGASNVFAQNVGLLTSGRTAIPNGTYYFRVAAMNAAGSSTSSEVQAIVGPSPPSVPVARDDAYTMNQGGVLTVPAPGVLANDAIPSGHRALVEFFSSPGVQPPPCNMGFFQNAGGGGFVWDLTRNPGFAGRCAFYYVVYGQSAQSNLATVTVTVVAR